MKYAIYILLMAIAVSLPKQKPVDVPTLDLELKGVKKDSVMNRDIRIKKNYGGMKRGTPDTLEFSVPLEPTFSKKGRNDNIRVKVIIEREKELEPIKGDTIKIDSSKIKPRRK